MLELVLPDPGTMCLARLGRSESQATGSGPGLTGLSDCDGGHWPGKMQEMGIGNRRSVADPEVGALNASNASVSRFLARLAHSPLHACRLRRGLRRGLLHGWKLRSSRKN